MTGFAALLALGIDACLSTQAQPLRERPDAASRATAAARAGEALAVEAALDGWYRVRSADGRRRGHLPAPACLLSVHSRFAAAEAAGFAADVRFDFDGDRRPDTLGVALAGVRPTLVLATAAGRRWSLDPAAAEPLLIGDRNGLELQAVEAREVVGGAPKELVVTGGFPVEGGSRSNTTVYRVAGDRLAPVFDAEVHAVYMYAGYATCASLRFGGGAVEVRSLVFEGEEVPDFVDQRLSARTDRHPWDAKARRFTAAPASTVRGPVTARTRHAVALRAGPESSDPHALLEPPDAPQPPAPPVLGPASTFARLPAGAPVEVLRWRTTDVLETVVWDRRTGLPLEVRGPGGVTGWLLTADVTPDDPALCPELFAD